VVTDTEAVTCHVDVARQLLDSTLSPRRRRLFEQIHAAVIAELEQLTHRVIDTLQATIPAYAAVSRQDLYAGVAGDIGSAVTAVAAARPASAEELELCEAVGEQRATQGLPVEALLQAFHVAGQEMLDYSLALGERLGAKPEDLLEFSRIGWAWTNQAMTSAALGHRRTDLDLARRDVQQRDDLLRALVLGSAGPAEGRRIPLYGMSTTAGYHVLRARRLGDGPDPEELVARLRRERPAGALIGIVDGDVVALSGTVPALPAGWCAGLAGPAPLLEMHAHFGDASRAVQTAFSFGSVGVHRLVDLGALPGVIVDRRLGDLASERWIEPLGDEATRERICATLDALFAHDLHVPAAAAALYVHENTVRKRLRQAEERTGINLRRVDDLVSLWWALRFRQSRGVEQDTKAA
jgi:hypothetical protein